MRILGNTQTEPEPPPDVPMLAPPNMPFGNITVGMQTYGIVDRQVMVHAWNVQALTRRGFTR